MSGSAPGPASGAPHPIQLARRIPFLESLGVRVLEFGAGRAVLSLELAPHHTNSWDMAHGGVVMTLLDVAVAMATRSLSPDQSAGAITVEMKTTFFSPARGPTITAHGHCLHRGATLAFCEAELKDADGSTAARATGTFKPQKK
jgi:uncharacterized protein (TIGR00369 family)